MAPFKLNFRLGSTSRSTSQESSSEPSAQPHAITATASSVDYSQQQRAKLFGTSSSTEIVPESTSSRINSPSMEFEDEERARNDRSALLQRGAFYSISSHQQQQPEQNAYDNPTIQPEEHIEQDERPNNEPSVSGGNPNKTPISPPPSYEHVLNENRLYSSTSASALSCPHHSPRLESASGGPQVLESSDSDSQCNMIMTQSCCCQLIEAPLSSALDQPQSNLLGPADTEAITLEASDTYPEEMFTAWQNKAAQNGGEIEISNKCSKKLYKMACQDGYAICKMSSECRCDDCQSHYFDCDFDNNGHQATDGGLGAGTPMFINEVMHGAACNIL